MKVTRYVVLFKQNVLNSYYVSTRSFETPEEAEEYGEICSGDGIEVYSINLIEVVIK